jgi:hypothetical protein
MNKAAIEWLENESRWHLGRTELRTRLTTMDGHPCTYFVASLPDVRPGDGRMFSLKTDYGGGDSMHWTAASSDMDSWTGDFID